MLSTPMGKGAKVLVLAARRPTELHTSADGIPVVRKGSVMAERKADPQIRMSAAVGPAVSQAEKPELLAQVIPG